MDNRIMAALIGFIAGAILIWVFFYFKRVGTLLAIRDEEDENPYLLLELSKEISSVVKKKYVVMRVSRK